MIAVLASILGAIVLGGGGIYLYYKKFRHSRSSTQLPQSANYVVDVDSLKNSTRIILGGDSSSFAVGNNE